MRPKFWSSFACAVLALGLSCQASAAEGLKDIKFLTNYVFNGRHAPFFVGVEKGFYKEAGFNVEIAPATGSGFVITAIDAGQADYGMAGFSNVIQGLSKGAKLKSLMVYTDVTTSGLISLSQFPSPESVIDRTIGASQADSSRVVLPIIFEEHKLDTSRLKFLTADPGVYSSLLISGQVDMVTGTSDSDMPALTKLTAAQGKTAYFSSFRDWGYDDFGYVIVARDQTVAQNPDEAKRFVEATKKAVEYAIRHPEEAADIIVKANPQMNRETVFLQWSAAIKSIQTEYVAAHGYGNATPERIARAISLVSKALKIDIGLKPEQVFMLSGQ